nr:glycogen/starch/alpha-glucan phosphorylase [Armatimonadota bacterium]
METTLAPTPDSAPTVDGAAVKDSLSHYVRYSLAKEWDDLSKRDLLLSTSLAVRDQMVEGMLDTEKRYQEADVKRLYYLSMEFLIGRSLRNNLYNLELMEVCRDALREKGIDVDELAELESDAALGNGGLGRLAACFLDSLATLGMPGFGYGINYEYGLFRQLIENGYQREKPDNWLTYGTPWQIERPAEACRIPVYGHVEDSVDRKGAYNPMWMDWKVLV